MERRRLLFTEKRENLHPEDYLSFKVTSGAASFSFSGTSPNSIRNILEYSTNEGRDWTTLSYGESTPKIGPNKEAGDTILWRGTCNSVGGIDTSPESTVGIGTFGVSQFEDTGQFIVEGNIMSLFFGDNAKNHTTLIKENSLILFPFAKLFKSNTKILRFKAALPFKTLTRGCYYSMFEGCTSLVEVPSLPAETTESANNILVGGLEKYCYGKMFKGCTSLTKAPIISALISNTTEALDYCCISMFEGCSSLNNITNISSFTILLTSGLTLTKGVFTAMFKGCKITTAPSLPSLYVGKNSYESMFENCTSLTSAPKISNTAKLPALTIESACYKNMFKGCTNLGVAPFLPATDISNANSCYESMFENCSELLLPINFKLDALTVPEKGYCRMFYGCSTLTIPSSFTLPATTLGSGGHNYEQMFYNCTSIITAPVFPQNDTVILYGESNYYQMFYSCTKLTTISSLNSKREDNFIPPRCCYEMFAGCSVLNIDANFKLNENATSISTYAYYHMFDSSGVSYVPSLPATTVSSYSYMGMFKNCKNLLVIQNGPLPALTAERSCYASMFSDCTNLTTIWTDNNDENASFLPATKLAIECYMRMFSNTKIDTVPLKLLYAATTLSDSCYLGMFSDCTFLTVPPELPATKLVLACYYEMFNNCTSLTVSPDLPAIDLEFNCYYKTFYNTLAIPDCSHILFSNDQNGRNQVLAGGYRGLFAGTKITDTILEQIFTSKSINNYSLPNINLNNQGCYSEMFLDCSLLETPPVLPSTTLGTECYRLMFSGCVSLTSTPELPATALADQCYYYMFSRTNVLPDCTNIDFTSSTIVQSGGLRGLFARTKVTDALLSQILPTNPNTNNLCLPVTSLSNNCYEQMFGGCTSLTTAPELPATTLANSCYYQMFYGCSGLTAAPELPATTLVDRCYYQMFQGCTSLTTAPSLPATTLANSCYYGMFNNCTSLTTVPSELPATTLADSCYASMFRRCSFNLAPKLPALSLVSKCYSSMFWYCLNLEKVICLAKENIGTSNSTTDWLYEVKSTGLFYNNPEVSANDWGRSASGIPSGWTVYNYNGN